MLARREKCLGELNLNKLLNSELFLMISHYRLLTLRDSYLKAKPALYNPYLASQM